MIYTILSAVIQICDVQFDFDQETGGSYIVDEYILEVGKSMDRSILIDLYVFNRYVCLNLEFWQNLP